MRRTTFSRPISRPSPARASPARGRSTSVSRASPVRRSTPSRPAVRRSSAANRVAPPRRSSPARPAIRKGAPAPKRPVRKTPPRPSISRGGARKPSISKPPSLRQPVSSSRSSRRTPQQQAKPAAKQPQRRNSPATPRHVAPKRQQQVKRNIAPQPRRQQVRQQVRRVVAQPRPAPARRRTNPQPRPALKPRSSVRQATPVRRPAPRAPIQNRLPAKQAAPVKRTITKPSVPPRRGNVPNRLPSTVRRPQPRVNNIPKRQNTAVQRGKPTSTNNSNKKVQPLVKNGPKRQVPVKPTPPRVQPRPRVQVPRHNLKPNPRYTGQNVYPRQTRQVLNNKSVPTRPQQQGRNQSKPPQQGPVKQQVKTEPTGTTSSTIAQQAAKIVQYEGRFDKNGNLKVYALPKADGGGTFEVAGINDRYHPQQAAYLKSLIESGQFAKAKQEAVNYMTSYTAQTSKWTNVPAIQFFMRDSLFVNIFFVVVNIFSLKLFVTQQ